MTVGAGSYDTQQAGALIDIQYDSLGLRLASASEDGVVRIWSTETHELLNELRFHKAPVLSLAWASGRFATTLASVSSDGLIVISREVRPKEWLVVHQLELRGDVSMISFAPGEYGVVLAAASLAGEVHIVSRREISVSPVVPAGESWLSKSFFAHAGGVAALTWAPSTSPAVLATGPAVQKAASCAPRRLATAGRDGVVRIWLHSSSGDSWSEVCQLSSPKLLGNVRDIAWRPNLGTPSSLIAICTEGGCVGTWSQDVNGKDWQLQACWNVASDARRVTWSKAGLLLAVSVGDRDAAIFREECCGSWSAMTSFDE